MSSQTETSRRCSLVIHYVTTTIICLKIPVGRYLGESFIPASKIHPPVLTQVGTLHFNIRLNCLVQIEISFRVYPVIGTARSNQLFLNLSAPGGYQLNRASALTERRFNKGKL